MRNLFFSKFIFITFFYIINSSEFISFDLKYFYQEEYPSFSYLYTELKIGEPESHIYTYISTEKPMFSMYEIIKKLDEKESLNYYNISSSTTFKNISNLGFMIVTSEKDIHAQEKLKLNYYNNETKKYREISVNNIDFALGVRLFQTSGRIYFMNIGFPIIKSNTIRDKFNFILQLKEKNIIENYDWFVLYNYNELNLKENEIFNLEKIQNIKPTLIIGGPPHFYNSDKFFKSQLLTDYSEVDAWTLKFKDVYLYIDDTTTGGKKKLSTFLETVHIHLDDINIYASPYFTNLVRREYFSKYKSCHSDKDEDYIKYYCDKSENFTINDLKNFPTLYFQHNEFNITLELTYQDLFAEYNNKYYFLIIESNVEDWKIGFPLLKKYQFMFNQDSKTVGFYNPNLPKGEGKEEDKDKDKEGEKDKDKEIDDGSSDKNKTSNDTKNATDNDEMNKDSKNGTDNKTNEKNNDGSMSTKTVVLIVILSGIVFIFIGLIIGKLIFKKLNKKVRVNELEENYDYITPENENIN